MSVSGFNGIDVSITKINEGYVPGTVARIKIIRPDLFVRMIWLEGMINKLSAIGCVRAVGAFRKDYETLLSKMRKE